MAIIYKDTYELTCCAS